MDSYSALWDNGDCTQSSLFVDLLKQGVTDVYICGLALDVCVKHTAMDAINQGFRTYVIVDGCRGVSPKGITETKEEFTKNGIILLESNKVGTIIIKSHPVSIIIHVYNCTFTAIHHLEKNSRDLEDKVDS